MAYAGIAKPWEGCLTLYGRPNTRVRYRFDNLDQARAHLHEVEGRALFFCRDEKIRFLPDAPVCLSFAFSGGEVTRLLHGQVAAGVEGSGTWIEIRDVRPLRELTPTEAVRRSIRLGCDAPVEARGDTRNATVRMLDLSVGGARFSGAAGFSAGDRLELRLLGTDGITFHDLAYAVVVWADGSEMGVRFDLSDVVGRRAVRRLIDESENLWEEAWEGDHASGCCTGKGMLDPEAPSIQRLRAPGSSSTTSENTGT